jgi:hypothetical protein
MPRMQKMILRGPSAPWNIALPTSPKSFLKRPEGRLWVLRSYRLLKYQWRDRKNRFFWWPGCRIPFNMPFQQLTTTLRRLPKSSFLRHPEGRLWVLSAIRLFKHHLSDFVKLAFSMPRVQKIITHAFRHHETSLHRPSKSFFKTIIRQITSSQGHSRT